MNDSQPVIDELLAGFDLARSASAAAAAHRREMETLLLSFLEVLDSLQALEARARELESADNPRISVRAVTTIVKQAAQALEQAGAIPMNCEGQPLDLVLHEVVEVRRSDDMTPDTVVEEILRGYLWHNKTLRLARVAIAGDQGSRDTGEDHESDRH